LADEPGAGKTIMAGLLIKELILRGSLKRCLIVCPGSLGEQWSDELKEKFGLSFRQLNKNSLDEANQVNPFLESNFMIARMDQLARSSDQVKKRLEETDWDLVIIDEAHRMSAQHVGFKNEASKTLRFQLGQLLSKQTTHMHLMTATPHTGSDENFLLF
jgi:superfamily II DNA or RNA helicase